jgi:hypothetical protein
MTFYDLALNTDDPGKNIENLFKSLNRRIEQLERRLTVAPGQWTSFTPSIVQGVAVSSTVGYARYCRVGRLIVGNAFVTCTSTGTANTYITAGMPVAHASGQYIAVGSGWWVRRTDVPVIVMPFIVFPLTSTTFAFQAGDSAHTNGVVGATGDLPHYNGALVSTDELSFSFAYETTD